MRIGLATLPFAGSIESAVENVRHALNTAAAEGARIVCTPENYLPGLRDAGFDVDDVKPEELWSAFDTVADYVRESRVALILGTEFPTPDGTSVSALVYDSSGRILGRQDKVQLDPDEDDIFVRGTCRSIFEIEGLRFGISICHEASHYPETVRWAAERGAQVVFHPQLGFPTSWGGRPQRWADPENSIHEKAFMCRAAENSIYFVTVNYAVDGSRTTSAVINPDGSLLMHQPYGEPGLLTADLDLDKATRLFAKRFRPEAYQAEA
jgi:predicted amidohydrolase